ncbi:MAG TPA: tyrosine--tRNA ligase [Candidatus Acidoferrales bacterium]|nr:tyrosine--tRNA ligase [Candidatus Acidoferrales bacterium]
MASDLWERLQSRAVQIHVADHLRARIQSGEMLRVKLGLDPTAPDLHVGHLVVLDVLRAFQDRGHTVVAIIGDFTALIGDPSGRSDTRPVLTPQQVDANAKTYFDQIFKILDPARTEIHGNSEWLASMGAAEVLGLLGKQTLQAVLQRDDFSRRIKAGNPIGAHEILYPFNQGYDSVAVRADLEIGGSDQLFNLMFGREVQRGYGQAPQDVAVFPLLEGTDGVRKMSKSLDNSIGLMEAPDQVYGKTMSIPDPLTPTYLKLISGLEPESIQAALQGGPREAKAALARALVGRLWGGAEVAPAEEAFDARYRRREIRAEELAEHRPADPADLVGTLVELGWYPTRSQARRVVEQGGVSLDGIRAGLEARLTEGTVLRAGKRNYVRIGVG